MTRPESDRHYDIAVLGGGFGGVYTTQTLLKKFGRAYGPRIGLFSDQNYLVFQPMLPEVAGSSLSPRHVVANLRQLCADARIHRGQVEAIDLDAKRFVLRPGPFAANVSISYEKLVLALGAEIDLSRVPGMPEHAFLMRNVGDAMILRATLIERFEEANIEQRPDVRKRLLTFVVVGGGYSGVETAGQILDLCHDVHRFYSGVGPDDFRVVLVHSQEKLLPTLSSGLADYTHRELTKRGMEVLLKERVSAVTASRVYLAAGKPIETNTVISTVGNAPHPLVTDLVQRYGLEQLRGRVKTDGCLRVQGCDDVFALGDCAAVPLPSGEAAPATAQFATRQGERLGKNLFLMSHGRDPQPFQFEGLGELAAIGHQRAVANVLGMNFSGFFAWWMWRTIYLSKLPTLERKLRVVLDWTLDLFFPKDLNLISPRYTRPLRQVHLEKGDILFNAGDPAFSLHVLKKGRVDLVDDAGAIVRAINPGEYFGERALTHGEPYLYTARAAETSTLVSVGGEIFRQMVEDSILLQRLFRRTSAQYLPEVEIAAIKERLVEGATDRPVIEVMNKAFVTLLATDTLTTALETVRNNSHHSFPVLNEHGQPAGVLDRDDLLDFLKLRDFDAGKRLSEYTLRQVPSVGCDDSLDDVIELMVRRGVHKLLVLDPDGKLAGIISIMDLLTTQPQALAN